MDDVQVKRGEAARQQPAVAVSERDREAAWAAMRAADHARGLDAKTECFAQAIAQARAEERERLALADKWARFGVSAFREFWGDGEPCDLDGGTVQDMAVAAGLLRRMTDAECNEPDAHCEFCDWKQGDPASECQCLLPTCGDYRPEAAIRARGEK